MIPVQPKPEPNNFDQNVRRPGRQWLKKKGIPLNRKLPAGSKLKPYWRRCLDDLHRQYHGTCAYLCVFVERGIGGVSVDHFIAKSRLPKLAYEWSNYRLACMALNAKKNDFDDLLDPFSLAPETFHLELVTGRIYPNPALSPEAKMAAQKTIDRLGLDGRQYREMRARHYQQYREEEDYTEAYLRRISPFVWSEANRQNLLYYLPLWTNFPAGRPGLYGTQN